MSKLHFSELPVRLSIYINLTVFLVYHVIALNRCYTVFSDMMTMGDDTKDKDDDNQDDGDEGNDENDVNIT